MHKSPFPGFQVTPKKHKKGTKKKRNGKKPFLGPSPVQTGPQWDL